MAGMSLLDIILMNFVAVASLRWIASAASSGPSSLTLWIFAALFFFLPQALAVIHLSTKFPEDGGLYKWTQHALGDFHGFLCGWCYWVTNLLYFPSLLFYVSANVGFAGESFFPGIGSTSNKTFVILVTLGSLWLVTLLGFLGLKAGKWLQNLGGLGNWIPATVVSFLGIYTFYRFGSANAFNAETMVPRFQNPAQWTFFAQMCFAFAGLELVCFMGGEIRNPQKNLTWGAVISGVVIASVYLLGTWAILVSVPLEKISPLNGLILPLQEVGHRWGISWLAGAGALFIGLAGLGGTMAWFQGASRIPYVVGVDRFLPETFSRLHRKFRTPYVTILVQGGLATVFMLLAASGENTKTEYVYKILVDTCLLLYFIPYGYLFISAYRLAHRKPLLRLACGFGLLTTLIAILTTAIPLDGTGGVNTVVKVIAGTVFMLLLGVLLYLRGSSDRAQTLRPAPGHGVDSA